MCQILIQSGSFFGPLACNVYPILIYLSDRRLCEWIVKCIHGRRIRYTSSKKLLWMSWNGLVVNQALRFESFMRSEKARDVEMTLAKHSHMVRSKSLKCLKSRWKLVRLCQDFISQSPKSLQSRQSSHKYNTVPPLPTLLSASPEPSSIHPSIDWTPTTVHSTLESSPSWVLTNPSLQRLPLVLTLPTLLPSEAYSVAIWAHGQTPSPRRPVSPTCAKFKQLTIHDNR